MKTLSTRVTYLAGEHAQAFHHAIHGLLQLQYLTTHIDLHIDLDLVGQITPCDSFRSLRDRLYESLITEFAVD